jgi:UDP-N-acetylglucosamine/UDP-N-acetylgalactosamine 4-epimerase
MNNFHHTDISGFSFLITGGAGFIGSHITAYLLHHGAKRVRILDNLATGFEVNIKPHLSHPSFEFIRGDIRDPKVCATACEDMDYVTHQAALGSVPRSIKDPLSTHAVNATGFLNVLVAARDAKVKRFVYASSSSVYGDHPKLPKTETETGKPLSPYAVSKKTNELYASVFAETYKMEIIGLRYFNVFGPNQSPEGPYAAVIPLFMHNALAGIAPQIDGDGNQTRDFTYVENAVQANIRAFFSTHPEATGKVYNVAVGERVSVLSLYDKIAELTGTAVRPVHRDSRPGDIRDSLADIGMAKSFLGYDPEIKVMEGLKRTIAWFQTQQN